MTDNEIDALEGVQLRIAVTQEVLLQHWPLIELGAVLAFQEVLLPYDTEIEQVFVLINEISATHYCVMKTPFEPGGRYHAYFELHGHTDTRPMWHGSDANSLAAAVCRAWLKAATGWRGANIQEGS